MVMASGGLVDVAVGPQEAQPHGQFDGEIADHPLADGAGRAAEGIDDVLDRPLIVLEGEVRVRTQFDEGTDVGGEGSSGPGAEAGAVHDLVDEHRLVEGVVEPEEAADVVREFIVLPQVIGKAVLDPQAEQVVQVRDPRVPDHRLRSNLEAGVVEYEIVRRQRHLVPAECKPAAPADPAPPLVVPHLSVQAEATGSGDGLVEQRSVVPEVDLRLDAAPILIAQG